MNIDPIPTLRVVLLIAAVMQLAMSTVFFEPLQERLVRPMLRTAEDQGRPVPTALRWYFTSRIPAFAMTAVLAVLAWFVGTPAAATLLENLRSGS